MRCLESSSGKIALRFLLTDYAETVMLAAKSNDGGFFSISEHSPNFPGGVSIYRNQLTARMLAFSFIMSLAFSIGTLIPKQSWEAGEYLGIL